MCDRPWRARVRGSARPDGGAVRAAGWTEWDHHHVVVRHRRVALVTGSSRGLGAVIARRLAHDGFAVAVNGRPGDEQVAAVGRAIRADGGTAEGFYADVTDEDQVAGLAAAITDRLGQ